MHTTKEAMLWPFRTTPKLITLGKLKPKLLPILSFFSSSAKEEFTSQLEKMTTLSIPSITVDPYCRKLHTSTPTELCLIADWEKLCIMPRSMS